MALFRFTESFQPFPCTQHGRLLAHNPRRKRLPRLLNPIHFTKGLPSLNNGKQNRPNQSQFSDLPRSSQAVTMMRQLAWKPSLIVRSPWSPRMGPKRTGPSVHPAGLVIRPPRGGLCFNISVSSCFFFRSALGPSLRTTPSRSREITLKPAP